jgi:hypothetical protein
VAITDNQGKVVGGLLWGPIGNKENFKTSTSTSTQGKVGETPTITVTTVLPEFAVSTTALAPADWQARLRSSANVSSIDIHNLTYNCPKMGPVAPGSITSIAPQQAGTYVAVTFSATGISYDDALYTVSDMGFRLAAPCYEHETGSPADWHPMGQQQTFAQTHMLTLATTSMSPTDWQTRITHTSSVKKVDTSIKVVASCTSAS